MAGKEDAAPQSGHVLYLVFGGELTAVDSLEFKDVNAIDVVGIFGDYNAAYDAWKDASHRHIDNALMRYFIIDLDGFLAASIDAKL